MGLDMIEIVMALEDEFEIEISDTDLPFRGFTAGALRN